MEGNYLITNNKAHVIIDAFATLDGRGYINRLALLENNLGILLNAENFPSTSTSSTDIGEIGGSIQGEQSRTLEKELRRTYSTDSLRNTTEDGATTQLEFIPIYPHHGALAVKAPKCAQDFIDSEGGCMSGDSQ